MIAATTRWLVNAYPSTGGALAATLAGVQAGQAVTVAALLRYPTRVDAGLLAVLGPGGPTALDRATGRDDVAADADPSGETWRGWVDDVVASWAACLLSDPQTARAAVSAIAAGEHTGRLMCEYRRLTEPGPLDHRATALLRHPDLVAPVADLHRAALLRLLDRPVPSC